MKTILIAGLLFSTAAPTIGAAPSPTAAPGLINAVPGSTTTTPGTPAPGNTGPGSPVTSYTPASATATQAAASGYTPNGFTVTPNQTVAGPLWLVLAALEQRP